MNYYLIMDKPSLWSYHFFDNPNSFIPTWDKITGRLFGYQEKESIVSFGFNSSVINLLLPSV